MKQPSMLLKVVLCLILLLLATVPSEIHARPTLPPPLFKRGALDIGQVGQRGSFIENGDTDRIWGSGSNIWGHHDQFHYVWYDLSGDGQMQVKVLSQDGTNDWAKAGIMLRETVADNAINVFLALTPHHGTTFQWRGTSNGLTHNRPGPQITAPVWLKLIRHNSIITGLISGNGTAWTTVSSVTLTMQTSSLIGLAVTAHNNTVHSSVVFTHVMLNSGPPALTAIRVYGQGDSFITNIINNGGISATSLDYPEGIALDSSNNLYITDIDNNRVLYYPAGNTTATRVYGQGGSFTTNTTDNGGISATSLGYPEGIALDSSGGLYIADTGNSRVLYYPAGSTTATRVYGQGGSFTTNTPNNDGISATSLFEPEGVALDSSNNLYIADTGNSRVLYYPAGSTTATRVYGQGDSFTTRTSNNGDISATSLGYPEGIALDSSNNLYIADTGNNRVLYYPAGSTTATRVYGQGGSFTNSTLNNGGISATNLDYPEGVALDSSNNLYIADTGNSRVLYYPAGSTTATRVYGQGENFTTNTPNGGISATSPWSPISATSLWSPKGVAVDSSGNLYVSDSSNSRVLIFSL